MKIKDIFCNLKLRGSRMGYVMILVVVFVPVMLLVTKYCLDLQTMIMRSEKVGNIIIIKRCAKEAALKVAQNWNPALSRNQQKESMLRLADEIYNASPAYNSTSIKYNAIPGLEMPTKIKVTKGKQYDPLKVEVTETLSLSPSSKSIAYKEEELKSGRYMVGSVQRNLSCSLASLFDAVYNFANYDPHFILEDTVRDLGIQTASSAANASYYPRFTMYSLNLAELKKVTYKNQVTLEGSETSSKIQTRANPNDTTVQVTVEGDRIKVQTDEDIAYATPASCNVDIVLGIPVNGAANNVNNLDANTTTAGEAYWINQAEATADGKKTPIYQIAHALKEKLIAPLKYTRGVNVGIVPYCGMCSLPVNRMGNWSSEPENFIATDFLADQNAYQAYIRGCFLYGPTHIVDGLVGHTPHYEMDAFFWTNVMARKGKISIEATYGRNILCCGDLLSIADPAATETATFSPKFMRRPIRKIKWTTWKCKFLIDEF